MKINGEFIKRNVAGETIYVPVGSTALNFNGICSGNEVANLIFDMLLKDSEKNEIIDLIVSEYDVDRQTAENDFDEIIKKLDEQNLLLK